jgi:serine protease Do
MRPVGEQGGTTMMNKIGSFFRKRSFGYPAIAVIAATFLLGGMLIASSAETASHAGATMPIVRTANGTPPSFVDLAAALEPAVVNIKVTKIEKTEGPGMPDMEGPSGDLFEQFFGQMPRMPEKFKSQGAGSGVIINSDGTVLTNNHVVDGANEIVVTLADKKEYKARVLGRDPKTDLAVIKMEGKGPFPAAALGNSESTRVGEWVLAIGNPFGLSNTVTAGIISAKGRIIGAGPYDDFIQTDAPINPGNSGGPLINMHGEVIGINTAIVPNGQGIGFAIPINTAKTFLPELVSKGTVTRGYLGVNIQDVTPDLAASLNLKEAKGALVGEVADESPAAHAGVKTGDVITGFAGKEIKDPHQLSALVAATPIGSTVPLKINRDGKDMTLEVKVARLDAREPGVPRSEELSQGKWGMQLQELTPDLARQLGAKNHAGVVVAGVQPGSPADNAAVQSGDIILEVDRHPVKNVDDVKERIEKAPHKDSLLLLVQREGKSLYLVLKG